MDEELSIYEKNLSIATDESQLSEDPTERPSQRRRRPPAGIPPNPALCKRCNVSLQVDDSFLKPYLKKSEAGDLYLGDRQRWPRLVFGGIDYVRDDHVATLPGLSRAADSGCRFCAAVKEGLQNKYRGTSWWKPHPKPLVLRFQYCWVVGNGPIVLDSVVVSVKHREVARSREKSFAPNESRLRQWEAHAFRFPIYGAGGTPTRSCHSTLKDLWVPRYQSDPPLTDEDPCRKWLNLTRQLSDNAWSPQNISMCQRWINECIDETGLCKREKPQLLGPTPGSNDGSNECLTADSDTDNQSEAREIRGASVGRAQIDQPGKHTSDPFLPTRLLDLCPTPAQSPGCMSLVETTGLQRDLISDESESHIVRYAALSYCWGDVKPTVTTTKDTINSHLRCLEFSSLPQCLQDAVTVTRGLGIRYLWIDALCIIQDDSDDWGKESGTMYQIFYNSFITIAAAASESFNEGFLTRPVEAVIDTSFSSALNPQVVGSFSLSTIPNPERRKFRHPLHEELRCCKWDTRGWVLQEQKLSKRLLVFGKQMIHLKCDHGVRSENGYNVEVVLPPRQDGRESWARWLHGFAEKQLTFPQDKLPAISGICKLLDQNSRLKGEGPAQYLAGIWYCSESRDPWHGWQNHLFWQLYPQEQSFQNMVENLKSTDPRSCIAPSWSWASRNERAIWRTYEPSGTSPPHFEAEIENHQMILTGPDPMGRVGPGCFLELSGLMCRDPLDLSAAERSDRSSEWEIPQTPYPHFSLDWKFSPEDGDYDMLKCGIRLFGLYIWQTNWDAEFRGLLLLQDSESRHYIRVGAFYTSVYPEDDIMETYERWERQSVHII